MNVFSKDIDPRKYYIVVNGDLRNKIDIVEAHTISRILRVFAVFKKPEIVRVIFLMSRSNNEIEVVKNFIKPFKVGYGERKLFEWQMNNLLAQTEGETENE